MWDARLQARTRTWSWVGVLRGEALAKVSCDRGRPKQARSGSASPVRITVARQYEKGGKRGIGSGGEPVLRAGRSLGGSNSPRLGSFVPLDMVGG
jgi:hypothetical protein